MEATEDTVKPRRVEHADDTRAALVQAARELFGKQGYADSSLDEVAERARVTKGALYHHFESKRALFRAVVSELRQEIAHRVRGRFAATLTSGDWSEAGDVWDRICTGYLSYLDVMSEDPVFQRIVVLEGPVVLGVETWSADTDREYEPLIGRWLEEAAAAGLIAPKSTTALGHILGAVIEAASREIVRHPGHDNRAARAEVTAVVEQLLHGLRASARVRDRRRSS